MSRQPTTHRCVWCGEPVGHYGGPTVLDVQLHRPRAECVLLRWHLEPECAAADPLHDALADALALPDDATGDAAAGAAYLAIVKRAREKGAEHLRAVVDVRRDFPTGSSTLRGPGLLWGVRSRRQTTTLARRRRRR